MLRISTAFYFQTGLNSLNKQQSNLVHNFQQLGSGKRMITAADDPLAAAQALRLGQSESMNVRFSENREVAMRNLGEEENALMSLIPQVYELKTRLVEVSNGTLSDSDRNTIADVLTEMRDSIQGLMNSQDGNGQYLFSGSKGNVEPFSLITHIDGVTGEVTHKEYQYEGDSRARLIQADQTRQIDSADDGLTVFGGGSENILNIMNSVIDTLRNKDELTGQAYDDQFKAVVGGAMTSVDKIYDNILTVRASVGARMNEIEAIEDSGKMQNLHLRTELSRLEDLDFYSAASQLELRRAGLEAASIAFQKIQATSLFAMNSR